MSAIDLVRRRIRMAGRGVLTGLPPATRELALSLTTRAAAGPTLLPGPPDGPVLVIAPHPDDEVIGPGGTLVRHVRAGHEVRVLILTSGGATAGVERDVTAVREEESRRAVRHLGLDAPIFAGLTDGALTDQAEQVAAAIDAHGEGVATVYVPTLLDPHPDHAAAARALASTALSDDVTVMGYEVWSAGPVSALVDVTDVFAAKQQALAEYRTALQTVDYVRSASGLAAYRSASGTLGGRGYAEGFIATSLGDHRMLVAGAGPPLG